jgi:hypothetical protein
MRRGGRRGRRGFVNLGGAGVKDGGDGRHNANDDQFFHNQGVIC